ncbi:MAG: DUF5680 domain-containing protein [Patescibacteria group bacterium]
MTESFLGELWMFLREARATTYAGDAQPSTSSTMPGFKLFALGNRTWTYRDVYAGSRLFGGYEAVWYMARPVWHMNYRGGMIECFRHDRRIAQQAYAMLREFLRQDSSRFEPRGGSHSAIIGAKGWRYHCVQLDANDRTIASPHWDIRDFRGKEQLVKVGERGPCYIGYFHGGLLID